MDFVILMIIVIVIVTIVSRFLGGEPRKPSDRLSPTGKTRKDSWPAPRSAAAAPTTTTTGVTPARTPPRPSDSERRARDPEIWETLSYSKSGEARRGPAGRDSVVPEFRFGGLQDDAKERAELREQRHEQLRADDDDRAVESTTPSGAEREPSTPSGAEREPAPELDPEDDLVPDLGLGLGLGPGPDTDPGPESSLELGTTGSTSVDLGTTPADAGPSPSGYDYSSIGSVYTSTSVYTSSSGLDPDSAEPAQDLDGSDAADEAEGETGDAADGNRPTGS